ncbi:MAG: hypothetical protein HXS52_02745 [Theionarchaea archaeon]|nr:hypothetical protein [Theionarchaea archaeon]
MLAGYLARRIFIGIPIIREIAASHRDDEYIIDTCFWSIENIYAVKGTRIEITERDLFEESKVT